MRRLVIIADNSLIVEAIRLGFRTSGEFRLVGHADGRRTSAQAIARAQPDVVLIDDMDRAERALELMRDIRAADERISILVLTVDVAPAWLAKLFDAGAIGVISKAAHPEALATLVRETLDGHIYHAAPSPDTSDEARSPAAPNDLPLTGRELEILRLVAAGASNGEVARKLWVTEQTVKFHLRNVYRKLHVANRTQASHLAYVAGLVGAHHEQGSPRPELAAVGS